MQLTLEHLKSILCYNPETGEWIWINPPNHNTRLLGKRAGNCRPDGYRLIRIRGRAYYSSRLAWFYMTGDWPKKEIDHKDRDPSNDRWENLREASSSENKFNRTYSNIRGVYASGNKWWAMVGRDNYLGMFDTLEEAVIARDEEAKRLGGNFAILNLEQDIMT